MTRDQAQPLYLPAGVAGPDTRAGYVADNGGGIEALDLASGRPFWRSGIAARPVMAVKDMVAVLREVHQSPNLLQLDMLDATRGTLLRESDPLVFPEWVTAHVVADESFSYTVRCQDYELSIEWEAHARYRGGAAPSPQVERAAAKAAAGMAKVDMRTGAVAMFRADAAPAPAPPPTLQDATLFSYQIGSADTWRTEPWKADDTLAVITGDIVGDGQVLRLQRWNPDSGNIDPPVELVAGEALVSYVTPDGCYLFIHSERPARAGAGERQPWWLFSVVTGRQLAVLSYDFGARETCVLDAKVFYIVDAQPPGDVDKKKILQSTLKSLDIVSGAVVWQRPLTPRQTRTRPALRQ